MNSKSRSRSPRDKQSPSPRGINISPDKYPQLYEPEDINRPDSPVSRLSPEPRLLNLAIDPLTPEKLVKFAKKKKNRSSQSPIVSSSSSSYNSLQFPPTSFRGGNIFKMNDSETSPHRSLATPPITSENSPVGNNTAHFQKLSIPVYDVNGSIVSDHSVSLTQDSFLSISPSSSARRSNSELFNNENERTKKILMSSKQSSPNRNSEVSQRSFSPNATNAYYVQNDLYYNINNINPNPNQINSMNINETRAQMMMPSSPQRLEHSQEIIEDDLPPTITSLVMPGVAPPPPIIYDNRPGSSFSYSDDSLRANIGNDESEISSYRTSKSYVRPSVPTISDNTENSFDDSSDFNTSINNRSIDTANMIKTSPRKHDGRQSVRFADTSDEIIPFESDNSGIFGKDILRMATTSTPPIPEENSDIDSFNVSNIEQNTSMNNDSTVEFSSRILESKDIVADVKNDDSFNYSKDDFTNNSYQLEAQPSLKVNNEHGVTEVDSFQHSFRSVQGIVHDKKEEEEDIKHNIITELIPEEITTDESEVAEPVETVSNLIIPSPEKIKQGSSSLLINTNSVLEQVITETKHVVANPNISKYASYVDLSATPVSGNLDDVTLENSSEFKLQRFDEVQEAHDEEPNLLEFAEATERNIEPEEVEIRETVRTASTSNVEEYKNEKVRNFRKALPSIPILITTDEQPSSTQPTATEKIVSENVITKVNSPRPSNLSISRNDSTNSKPLSRSSSFKIGNLPPEDDIYDDNIEISNLSPLTADYLAHTDNELIKNDKSILNTHTTNNIHNVYGSGMVVVPKISRNITPDISAEYFPPLVKAGFITEIHQSTGFFDKAKANSRFGMLAYVKTLSDVKVLLELIFSGRNYPWIQWIAAFWTIYIQPVNDLLLRQQYTNMLPPKQIIQYLGLLIHSAMNRKPVFVIMSLAPEKIFTQSLNKEAQVNGTAFNNDLFKMRPEICRINIQGTNEGLWTKSNSIYDLNAKCILLPLNGHENIIVEETVIGVPITFSLCKLNPEKRNGRARRNIPLNEECYIHISENQKVDMKSGSPFIQSSIIAKKVQRSLDRKSKREGAAPIPKPVRAELHNYSELFRIRTVSSLDYLEWTASFENVLSKSRKYATQGLTRDGKTVFGDRPNRLSLIHSLVQEQDPRRPSYNSLNSTTVDKVVIVEGPTEVRTKMTDQVISDMANEIETAKRNRIALEQKFRASTIPINNIDEKTLTNLTAMVDTVPGSSIKIQNTTPIYSKSSTPLSKLEDPHKKISSLTINSSDSPSMKDFEHALKEKRLKEEKIAKEQSKYLHKMEKKVMNIDEPPHHIYDNADLISRSSTPTSSLWAHVVSNGKYTDNQNEEQIIKVEKTQIPLNDNVKVVNMDNHFNNEEEVMENSTKKKSFFGSIFKKKTQDVDNEIIKKGQQSFVAPHFYNQEIQNKNSRYSSSHNSSRHSSIQSLSNHNIIKQAEVNTIPKNVYNPLPFENEERRDSGTSTPKHNYKEEIIVSKITKAPSPNLSKNVIEHTHIDDEDMSDVSSLGSSIVEEANIMRVTSKVPSYVNGYQDRTMQNNQVYIKNKKNSTSLMRNIPRVKFHNKSLDDEALLSLTYQQYLLTGQEQRLSVMNSINHNSNHLDTIHHKIVTERKIPLSSEVSSKVIDYSPSPYNAQLKGSPHSSLKSSVMIDSHSAHYFEDESSSFN